jgi:hypothetical protein
MMGYLWFSEGKVYFKKECYILQSFQFKAVFDEKSSINLKGNDGFFELKTP